MTAQGKVWLLTGTSSGFGRSIAEEVLARGGSVVATARDPRALGDLVARAPDRVHAIRLDVTKASEIRDAVASARERFGAIDVLVNNAGFSIVGAVEETSDDDLRATLEPMFFGPVALMRAVLPQMRERKSGTLVQITSVGGVITAPGFGAYCAAKHALEAVSESLAAEVAPFGIRVLIVEPGAFRTRLFGSAFRTMPAMPEYEATVGPTRAYAAHSDGVQAGDPAKAAKAIVDAVTAGAPTLRLPLGADAVQSIREKLAKVTADVNRTEGVATSTSHE
ncbi:MAG TPA: oxidoreductase [Polyangiaceae bacterium]|jgi:NAD(P)-dependent dehydrogenase (short-subunit alcohol dehydrogenase family)|nr:oxidoreductase [Polyangiaceae bacterium]